MANVDKDLEDTMSLLGEFGKYQAWQYSLHIISALTAGLHMLTLMTVAAVPPHQCLLPTLNTSIDFAEDANTTTPLLWHNGTTDLPRVVDTCTYIDERNVSRQCEAWVYDKTYFQSSRGMEWNFVCSQRWMGAVAQSAYMFGVFVGAVTSGSLADKYGRKIVFYICSVAQLILGVSVALVTEYYTFLVLRFLYGIFGSAGAYITGFVLTMELVGPSKRTACGMMFQLTFAMGFMLVPIWGSIIKDRVWLQITYGLHSALLLGHWWLMDESPRWLWAQGRVKEAVAIIQKGLKMNGSTAEIDAAKFISKAKIRHDDEDEERSYGASDLFRTPNLRKKTLNVCLNWFANSIVFYGLSLNMGNLVGNPFLMMTLSALVEMPAYILLSFVMDKAGRRCLISTLMLIGGSCCIMAATIPRSGGGTPTAVIVLVLLGKSCIAGSFAIIYNYTAELFPTVVRNTAVGIGSTCARFSGALTPLIMLLDFLDPKVPATIFGFIALLSGMLSTFLPETMNQPMPETIQDGEDFGKGDTCFTSCMRRKTRDGAAYQVTMQQVPESEKDKLNAA